MDPSLTPVLISRTALATILGEVERFATRGLFDHGAPYEAIAYPLAAMLPRGELVSPLELTGEQHIGALVIVDAMLPPESAKAFSPMNCHFEASGPEDLGMLNDAFNREIDARLAQSPRLGVLSKLHSHPFSGGDFLSGGDLAKNVFAPGAIVWRERRGLRTALMHVVNPSRSPSLGIDGRLNDCGWRLSTWALDDQERMVRWADATVVDDDHPAMQAARRPPYYQTEGGRTWCDGQKQALREAGFNPSRNVLPRGWRRYLITSGGRELCIALPPDSPRRPPRVLEVHDITTNRFEPLPLPRRFEKLQTLDELSLVELAGHYAPRRRAAARRAAQLTGPAGP
jgi:hypothetical protein